ncbi:MAG TPA: hypothetical protein VNQ90_00030 [Chthoniobacteraceae bacterium]|nr:hypothetical protein [Chthoniobacteraceae bacterium]
MLLARLESEHRITFLSNADTVSWVIRTYAGSRSGFEDWCCDERFTFAIDSARSAVGV